MKLNARESTQLPLNVTFVVYHEKIVTRQGPGKDSQLCSLCILSSQRINEDRWLILHFTDVDR